MAASMENYRVVRKISEGRFGTVMEAHAVDSGLRVAVKQVWARAPMPGLDYDPWQRSAEREIEVLRPLRHEHVIELLTHFRLSDGCCFAMVYPFMTFDLATVIRMKRPVAECLAKVALQMLLLGLSYLHGSSVIHRDLKPSNLLLAAGTGTLKIADFGSSKVMGGCTRNRGTGKFRDGSRDASLGVHEERYVDSGAGPGCMTRDVCSRWYKSPEMLFGSVTYDQTVDLWSSGCIWGEMLSPEGKALFRGGADLEQMCLVFQALGTVDEEGDWPEVKDLPDYGKVEFLPRPRQPFVWESQHSPEAIALLYKLLELNPSRRPHAAQALEHPTFKSDSLCPPAAAEDLVQDLDELTRPGNGYLDGSDCGEDAVDEDEDACSILDFNGCGDTEVLIFDDEGGGRFVPQDAGGDYEIDEEGGTTTRCALWDLSERSMREPLAEAISDRDDHEKQAHRAEVMVFPD